MHDLPVGILVNLTWGDSWRRPKAGLGRVVDAIQQTSRGLPKPTGPDDPSVDIYIYVSGKVWQHDDSGFRLGTLSARGRNWLRVSIFVPDQITEESESVSYFQETLEAVADAVRARLRKRRPEWPIDELVAQIRSLRPGS